MQITIRYLKDNKLATLEIGIALIFLQRKLAVYHVA